jgi:UDP-N-acetylglucosamine 2-epimerase (non-hydrolysing)
MGSRCGTIVKETMHILHVVGARPNFVKAAPVMRALEAWPDARQTLVHTGQHYDSNLSDIFFSELNMPAPDVNLEVGSGSHAAQTAEVMKRFETVVLERKPDVVLVYGDVNSTVAATLVCSKLHIRVGHVEAGLRSFDRTMPEEINRIVTDQLADMLFTPGEDGDINLQREGISAERIYHVGNVMIDSLIQLLPAVMRFSKNGVPQRYALVTLHRPSNVDDSANLKNILESLLEVNERLEVVFPLHPRTRQRIDRLGIKVEKLRFLEPLPYIEFLSLQRRAVVVITDSGGVQEETTYLGVPCLTMRNNTERPVTVNMGTNVLVGQDRRLLDSELTRILEGGAKKGSIPPLWDGRASGRIVQVLREYFAP